MYIFNIRATQHWALTWGNIFSFVVLLLLLLLCVFLWHILYCMNIVFCIFSWVLYLELMKSYPRTVINPSPEIVVKCSHIIHSQDKTSIKDLCYSKHASECYFKGTIVTVCLKGTDRHCLAPYADTGSNQKTGLFWKAMTIKLFCHLGKRTC